MMLTAKPPSNNPRHNNSFKNLFNSPSPSPLLSPSSFPSLSPLPSTSSNSPNPYTEFRNSGNQGVDELAKSPEEVTTGLMVSPHHSSQLLYDGSENDVSKIF